MEKINPSKIEIVTEFIRSKLDDYIIDTHTNCYNELFLKEYVIYELQQMKNLGVVDESIFLLYFNIDTLQEINAKYSPEAGDETITNIGYMIKQYIHQDDLLVKRNGPGFILYVHKGSKFNISEFASTIQQEIKKSEIFIEPTTVSISCVSSKEFDSELDAPELCLRMLIQGGKRINIVPSMGPNAFLDKDIPTLHTSIGKVLVVDNDPITQKILNQFFVKNAVEVVLANDCVEGLTIAKNVPFDAIIAEKTLPKMDAFTMKSHLNDSSFTMNTLFIMITHRKTTEVVQRANELRIDYVVQRPLMFEEVLGFIQREIKKRGTRL